jgi:hypothetical protein
MQLTAGDFQERYAAMSEDEIARLDRAGLGDLARECYDKEVAYRASAEYRDKQLQVAAELKAKAVAETQTCFFCGAAPVSPDTAARVEMHSGYEQTRGYRTKTHKWTPGVVQVGRCARCWGVHRKERNARRLAGLLSFPVFALLALLATMGLGPFVIVVAPVLWIGLLIISSSLFAWFLYLLPSFRGTKPLQSAYKSVAVDQALHDGWGKGPPLTFSLDVSRMFRKFTGVVEIP